MGKDKKIDKSQVEDPVTSIQKPSVTKGQLDDFQKRMAKKDPGEGSLFHIGEASHRAEATRLSEREIWTLAVANMQQEVLCTENREESALEIFQRHLFTLRISQDGDGREEQIIMYQLSKDEKEQERRKLFGT